MMTYKGYVAKVELDDEGGFFHGQVINMRDVITFQGQSIDELRREFEESVDDYLEFCAERGEKPEKPFSGQFMVRATPELHRAIAVAASRTNQSINAWVTATLQRAVDVRPALHAPRVRSSQIVHQAIINQAIIVNPMSPHLSDVETLNLMPSLRKAATQSLSTLTGSLPFERERLEDLGVVVEEGD